MKKKLLSLGLSFVLVTVFAVAGTFALSQGTANVVNTMTTGKVYIEHHEYERDDSGELANLREFTQRKSLVPAVYTGNGIVLGEVQTWTKSTNACEIKLIDSSVKNVIDKFVVVENTGSSDAYYRTVIAVEAPEGTESLLYLNVNEDEELFAWETIGYTMIEKVRYQLLVATYQPVLKAGEVSAPSLLQVLLKEEALNEDIEKFGDTMDILVVSQAVQAQGFENAKTALEKAFGKITPAMNPWFEAYKINGHELGGFTIVAPTTDDAYATALAEQIKTKYEIELSVVAADVFNGGDAIYVGTREFNHYGGFKYRVGSVVADDTCSVYIDGTGAALSAAIDRLISDYMSTETGSSFTVPESENGYYWNGKAASGYELIGVTERSLSEGVTFYELEYATDSIGNVQAYAVVVKPGANVEVAVAAAEITNLSDQQDAWVYEPLTVDQHAAKLEAAGKNVVAISNAGFFDLNDTGSHVPFGMQIIDGVVMQAPELYASGSHRNHSVRWFGMTTEGKYVIGDEFEFESIYGGDIENKVAGQIQNGIGGGLLMVKNGVPTCYNTSAAKRTAVGVTADGEGLALVCVTNALYTDLAQVFMDLDLDFDRVLNLDGGGSSALYVEDADGGLTGEYVQAEPRPVADALAIVTKKQD